MTRGRDLASLVGALDVLDLAERHALATAGWTLAGDVSATAEMWIDPVTGHAMRRPYALREVRRDAASETAARARAA